MRHAYFLSLLLLTSSPQHAYSDDFQIGKGLFEQERYSEAAEIFSDPLWKGISYYKTRQWDKAAEAFAQSDHSLARYNLGNAYAHMGHYALALEAFLHVKKQHPDYSDADLNAQLMRKLLSSDDEEGQKAAQNEARKIDELEDENSNPGNNEEQNEQETSTQENKEDNTSSDAEGSEKQKTGEQASTNSSMSEKTSASEPESPTPDTSPAPLTEQEGASNSTEAPPDVQAEELKQSTEQWLKSLKNQPEKYLKAKINIEIDRRRAAGTPAPNSESKW